MKGWGGIAWGIALSPISGFYTHIMNTGNTKYSFKDMLGGMLNAGIWATINSGVQQADAKINEASKNAQQNGTLPELQISDESYKARMPEEIIEMIGNFKKAITTIDDVGMLDVSYGITFESMPAADIPYSSGDAIALYQLKGPRILISDEMLLNPTGKGLPGDPGVYEYTHDRITGETGRYTLIGTIAHKIGHDWGYRNISGYMNMKFNQRENVAVCI